MPSWKSGVWRMAALACCRRPARAWSSQGLFCSASRLLGGSEACGGVGEQGGGEGLRAGFEGFGFYDFGDEAQAVGFVGGDGAGGEEQVAGSLFAYLQDEVGGDERGDEADAGFSVGEGLRRARRG